jgi:hypothetical protein
MCIDIRNRLCDRAQYFGNPIVTLDERGRVVQLLGYAINKRGEIIWRIAQ